MAKRKQAPTPAPPPSKPAREPAAKPKAKAKAPAPTPPPTPAPKRAPAKRPPIKAVQKAQDKGMTEAQIAAEAAKPLSELEEQFAVEYVVDMNGTKAYMRAHLAINRRDLKETSARSFASQLLTRINVAERIAALKAAQFERIEIDSDEQLRHVKAIANTDHRLLTGYHYYNCRYCWGAEGMYHRTVAEFDTDRAKHDEKEGERELAAIAREKQYTRRQFDEKGGPGFNPRKDPNPECGNCFGVGVGTSVMHDTRHLTPDGVILFAGVEETKDGLKIRAHDKLKAQDMIWKHKGLFEADNSQQGSVVVLDKEAADSMYAEAMAAAQATRGLMIARRKKLEAEDEAERTGAR